MYLFLIFTMALVATVVILVFFIDWKKKTTAKVEVSFPDNIEEQVQRVVEAYATIERIKTGSINPDQLDEVYKEAKLIVIANLRERIATCERELSELQRRHCEEATTKLRASSNRTAEDIKNTEDMRNQLLSDLAGHALVLT